MNEMEIWKRTLDVLEIDASFVDPDRGALALLDVDAIGFRKVPSREQLDAKREEERKRRSAYRAKLEAERPTRSAIRSRELRRKQKRKQR